MIDYNIRHNEMMKGILPASDADNGPTRRTSTATSSKFRNNKRHSTCAKGYVLLVSSLIEQNLIY